MPLRVTPGPRSLPVHFLTASAWPHHHDVLPKRMGPDSSGLSPLNLCLKVIWLPFSCFCEAFVTELRKVSHIASEGRKKLGLNAQDSLSFTEGSEPGLQAG